MIGEANGDVKLGQKMVAEYMNCYKWVIYSLLAKKLLIFTNLKQIITLNTLL